MKYLIAGTLLAVLFSCKEKKDTPDDVAGGPCTYKETVYPARLLQLVQQQDSTRYDAAFEVMRSETNSDTVYYHQLNNQYITADTLRKHKITIGAACQLVESRILTGACNPHIITIRLQTIQP